MLFQMSGCVGIENLQLWDWFCPKCEKMKKPHPSKQGFKARRPIAGATDREDAKMR